ncbi:MAG: type IV pilus secretin PilQ [Gammaproteobacteria bacterium]|nr:type IV pilus secretin PilQ [Gammaproteobacteria bacterium]
MNVKGIFNRGTFGRLAMAVVAASLLGLAPAASAQEGTIALQDIEVASLPGNQVQLRLRMSEPSPEPVAFTIDNPARLAIDLDGVYIDMDRRRTEVSIGDVRNVMTAESQGKTRVVINLADNIEYTTQRQGNDLLITLGGEASASSFGPVSAAAPTASTPAAAPASTPRKETKPRGRAITAIDFRRGPDGEGRIMVDLTDPKTIVDLKQEGQRTVIEFQGTTLPNELMQTYDVLDFATPVRNIEATRSANNARLVVNAGGEFEQLAYQADNRFTLELKPVIEDEDESRKKKEYTGERFSVNFQDIEVRALLQIIADLSGFNMVVSDSVSGNITLRLQDVPWDQALDIVLRTRGLAMRQNGNVILVAPQEEIAEIERKELEAAQQVRELEPLVSEFIQINYAKASELAALMKSDSNSLLSERGSVTIDERTNTLLVQDTDSRLSDIRRMIRQLDVPVKQVLIESRIVIANDDFNKELGVRLGYTDFSTEPGLGYPPNITSGTATQTLSMVEDLTAGNPVTLLDPDRFNVDMPVTSPAGQIAFAVLGRSHIVDLELSALQAEGEGEVVSSPRVVTANQTEALIRQGVEIPYQEASSSGATTTSFKQAVLQLKVTPQITPDDRVVLDLEVTNDSVGEQVPSATGGFVPSIDKREVATRVMVNNGETVVLGGIYQTTRNKIVSKVPLLGDIPGLGFLFRNTSEQNDKRELLIFVTPKILKEGLTVAE